MMVCGEQYVIVVGIQMMHKLCADNLDIQQEVNMTIVVTEIVLYQLRITR